MPTSLQILIINTVHENMPNTWVFMILIAVTMYSWLICMCRKPIQRIISELYMVVKNLNKRA